MKTRFVMLFLLASTAIHAVWEFVQCAPLYVEGRFPMSLANMLRVTVADVSLSALIYGAVALAQRDVAWGLQPKRWALLAAMATGAALAAGIEWHALSNHRWSYSPWMPTIFGLGLLPLLQLGAGTVLPLWMGQWGSRGRPAVSETPNRRTDVKGSSEIMSDKLVVPAAITAALESFDHRAGPCTEHEISSAIQAVRAPSGQVTEAENSGAWAELLAFSLTGGARENPWNTYFGPHSTQEDAAGKRYYTPNLEGVGPEFIAHWAQRADAVGNPILKARYADLCWDLGRRITGAKPAIRFAHLAIDAYLDGAEQGRHSAVTRQAVAIRRAGHIAVKIQDGPRRDRARAALLSLHAQAMERIREGERGPWWIGFREMQDNKGLGFTEPEHTQLIADVESVFAMRTSVSDPKRFDPRDARDAAQALIHQYRARNQPDDVKRVQRALAACLEHFAGLGDAMLAATILPDCVELYRESGLAQEARRVQRVLQEKIRDSRALMGQHEVVQQIPKEKMEDWLAAQCEGGLDAALGRIAEVFITREAEVRQQVADTAKTAPLFSLITKTIHAADHVAGKVGNAAADETGALVFDAHRLSQFGTFWLFHALDRVVELHGKDAAGWAARMNASGLFDDDTALLTKGVQAWFDDDHVQAVHLLIPQIERAVRELMHRIGQPVTKPHREVDGVSQSIGIGDALHSDEFSKAYGPDLRLHLMALYADPRGWNLRNRMAHGTLSAREMDAGMSAWLIQTLLLLSRRHALVGEGPA